MFGQNTSASFGNSTIDWGFLGALSGRRNYNAIKQDKLKELQFIQAQNAILDKEIALQEKSMEGVQEYLNTINNLKVLPEGLKRIQAVDKELRKNIEQGIYDANGDVKKWILSGGSRVLSEYKKNLESNEVTKRELSNAYNVNRWFADKQAGLQERIQFDENGNPLTMGVQYQKYKNGELDSLNYGGAFKMPEYKESITSRYAYEDKRKAKSATPTDVYWDAYHQFKDLNEQDRKQAATIQAQTYAKSLQDGKIAPLQFKHDQLSDVDRAKIANLNSSTRLNNTKSGILGSEPNGINSILLSIANNRISPTKNEVLVNSQGKEIALPYLATNIKAMDVYAGLGNVRVNDKGEIANGVEFLKNNQTYSVSEDGTMKSLDFSKVGENGVESMSLVDGKIYYLQGANGSVIPAIKAITKVKEHDGMEKILFGGVPIEKGNSNNLPLKANYRSEGFWPGFLSDDKRADIETYVPIDVNTLNLLQEKQGLGYFPKAKDAFVGSSLTREAINIMQGADDDYGVSDDSEQ